MGYDFVCKTFLYLMDCLIWMIPYSVIMVDFFGYRAKSSKHRHVLFGLITAGYTAVNVMLYYIAVKNGKAPGVLNGFLVLFLLIYWMIKLEERNKVRLFFVSFVAIEMVVVFMELVFATFGTIIQKDYASQESNVLLIILRPAIVITIIVVLSKLSGRMRNGAMSSFLVGVIFLVFVLLDSFISFFGYEGSDAFLPIVRLRVIYENADTLDQVLGVGILVTLSMFLLAFLLMIIKESESSYFRKKNAINEYYLETQKEHYESLIRSNREIRKMKHDMKNHVYCMKELTANGKYEQLKEYIDSLDDTLSQVEQNIYTGNEIADAIISEKIQRASAKEIILNVEGDLYGLEWNAMDICTIFSNLLDNALEAVDGLVRENRWIDLQIRKNKNFLIITERNPIEKDIIIVDNSITTTKKDRSNHGFGIVNIKETVAKYEGECRLLVETQEDKKEFVFEIIVPIGE